MYILDSDVMIYFLKGDERAIACVEQCIDEGLATTRINQAELYYGAWKSKRKNEIFKLFNEFFSHMTILDFTEESARCFGQMKATLEERGQILADMDLLIASICLSHQGTFVTNNVKHFKRIHQLFGLNLIPFSDIGKEKK